MGHFSAWAGAVALSFIVLPVVVRTTDEMLQLVPTVMRESALALGVPQWKVVRQVLYRAALSGILTGVLLALARIWADTAPVLFTALNQYWTSNLNQPMANVPVVIFHPAAVRAVGPAPPPLPAPTPVAARSKPPFCRPRQCRAAESPSGTIA